MTCVLSDHYIADIWGVFGMGKTYQFSIVNVIYFSHLRENQI